MQSSLKDKIIIVHDYYLFNPLENEIAEWAERNGLTVEYRTIHYYIKELNKVNALLSMAHEKIKKQDIEIEHLQYEVEDYRERTDRSFDE